MAKFRKKPVVIEAIQFTAKEDYNSLVKWCGGASDTEVRNCSPEHPDGFDYPCIRIKTLEGSMTASINDFIIKGVKGEFYPCKPDIFEQTYEAV